MAWTNRGKYKMLGWGLRGVTIPTNFYVALFTSAVAPGPDLNTKSELTEVAAGNGYTAGGIQVTPGATDFDTWTEDDGNDRALIQLRDLVWTASGGNLPGSGSGARYAVLTDDNATQGSRECYFYWDLGADRVVSDGQTLTLQDCELRINES
ncbi:MAG: hypothetical protein KJ063_02180 [Anaerolineae bacterium]|nr:hypothetical protein [Anaerolineae bacterium]